MAGGCLGESQGTARAASLGRVLSTTAPQATVLVRLLVGGVFLSEGIQKFLFPGALGVGRFEGIGILFPGFSAPLLGAFVTTKAPILLDSGFWTMAHEARNDYAQLLGSVFLLIVGAGPWSLDSRLA